MVRQISADAMLKVIDFGNDESGDILGLAFHTKYKTHFDSGSTLNLGLGFGSVQTTIQCMD